MESILVKCVYPLRDNKSRRCYYPLRPFLADGMALPDKCQERDKRQNIK